MSCDLLLVGIDWKIEMSKGEKGKKTCICFVDCLKLKTWHPGKLQSPAAGN